MIVLMHFVTLLLGGPIGGIPLIMMTIPIFMPVVKALGYDPIWFCTAMLLNVELAQITPPFGILLYVVRGIMPNTSMTRGDPRSGPDHRHQLVVMAMLIAIPAVAVAAQLHERPAKITKVDWCIDQPRPEERAPHPGARVPHLGRAPRRIAHAPSHDGSGTSATAGSRVWTGRPAGRMVAFARVNEGEGGCRAPPPRAAPV